MEESLGFASDYFISLGIISLIVVLRTMLTPDIPYILTFRDTIDIRVALSIRQATHFVIHLYLFLSVWV